MRFGKKQRISPHARQWVNSLPRGLLDTNVIIHSLADDPLSVECWNFMQQVRSGQVSVILDPLVIHELTYALPRYAKQWERTEIAGFIETLLHLPGVSGDTSRMVRAIGFWKENTGVGFVDCYLAVLANDEQLPVYTKNVRHLRRLAAEAPDPLPGS